MFGATASGAPRARPPPDTPGKFPPPSQRPTGPTPRTATDTKGIRSQSNPRGQPSRPRARGNRAPGALSHLRTLPENPSHKAKVSRSERRAPGTRQGCSGRIGKRARAGAKGDRRLREWVGVGAKRELGRAGVQVCEPGASGARVGGNGGSVRCGLVYDCSYIDRLYGGNADQVNK